MTLIFPIFVSVGKGKTNIFLGLSTLTYNKGYRENATMYNFKNGTVYTAPGTQTITF